ncbi:MAG: DUF2971 domain-containing protein [Micropepsaceae bacterium]
MQQSDTLPPGFEHLVAKFRSQADAHLNPILEAANQVSPPDTIYHYTDSAGLRGILEHGTIWQTDIFHLNDPSELRHGMSYALDALQAAEKGKKEVQLFARRFAELRDDGLQRSAHYFVTSFSAADDDLGQWRAYAEDGRGYAIGFDGKALSLAFDLDEAHETRMSFPIDYDDEKLRSLQTKVTEEVIPFLSGAKDLANDLKTMIAYFQQLSVQHALLALQAAALFKHPAYNNEREFRFLRIARADRPVNGIKHRSRPNRLVPYTEFAWRSKVQNALREFVIGPAAPKQTSEQFIRDCLRAYNPNCGTTPIRFSKIPYRSVHSD